MSPRLKTIMFAILIIGLGVAWGLWAEWPEILARGEADEDRRGAAAAVVAPQIVAPLLPAGKQIDFNFDGDPISQPPPRFHAALTGDGQPGSWVVQPDGTAPSRPNVLAQISTDKTDYRFPLMIADENLVRDFDLSVKFQPVSGDVDRAGGLVFRLKDANNYYVVRANALENNFNLYKVVDGRRGEIAGSAVKLSSGEWHQKSG